MNIVTIILFGESSKGEVKADFSIFPLADGEFDDVEFVDDEPSFGIVALVSLVLRFVDPVLNDIDEVDDDPGEPAEVVVAGDELEMADESEEFDSDSVAELNPRASCCF